MFVNLIIIALKVIFAIWVVSFFIALLLGGGSYLRKAGPIVASNEHIAREFKCGDENEMKPIEGELVLTPSKDNDENYVIRLFDALEGQDRVLYLYLPKDGTGQIDLIESRQANNEKILGKAYVVIKSREMNSKLSQAAFDLRTKKTGEISDPYGFLNGHFGFKATPLKDVPIVLAILDLSFGLDGSRFGANYAAWGPAEDGLCVKRVNSLFVDFRKCNIKIERFVRKPLASSSDLAKALFLDFITLPHQIVNVAVTALGGGVR